MSRARAFVRERTRRADVTLRFIRSIRDDRDYYTNAAPALGRVGEYARSCEMTMLRCPSVLPMGECRSA
ncbi:hypothetical protein A6P55_01815 [Pandoraea pnomenusa]|nr:hypothetical protein A6P55_01815 [Pandoraea pnomenusa]